MRTRKYMIVLLALMLSACHPQKNFTQTFVGESDPGQVLKLTSSRGLLRPAAEFPHNILFSVFGTNEISGTYLLTTGKETVKGSFTAGKDGEEQWIKFISENKKEWRVKVQPGGLVGPGDTVWNLQTVTADAKATAAISFGR